MNVAPDGEDEAKVGESVGRYTLLERLGEGGAGVVYRAQDGASGDVVALKILRRAHAGNAEHRRRFLREARVAAALEHEGVVRVREVDEDGDRVFLAMDLAPGISLRRAMDAARERGEPMAVAEVVTIAHAIAGAVAHAHARGIVHRDVKPDNVMVTSDLRVHVLDFGLAKLRETAGAIVYDAETETNVTIDGRVLGTPAYMSPEQATGKEVGFRTDVFSLGVVLYEMLAGVRPFAGVSAMDVIVSITRDEPPLPSAHDERIAPELDRLVMRCLAKNPSDRADMKDLATELADPELLQAPSRRPARFGAPASSTRSSLGPVAKGAAIGAMVLGCGVVAFALRSRDGAARSVAPATNGGSSATPVPPGAPTSVVDLPTPSSSVPEALAAYREAIQDEHDGAEDAALMELDRATTLDPSLAAGQLRLAIRLAFLEADSARAHFAQAAKGREQLARRDQDVLEAYRPLFQHDAPALDEWAKRLVSLTERYPNDADLWLDVAGLHNVLGEFVEDVDAARRALAIDPRFGLATSELAQAQAYLGDFDGARATIADCLAHTPNASWCMWTREYMNGSQGRCAENEASARERIAIDPTIPDGYKALYYALAALERPEPAVREAIEQTVKRMPDPSGAKRLRAALTARLDALYGDFVAAAREAKELGAIVEQSSDVMSHANATIVAVEIELETGRTDAAVRLASDFLGRRDAWAVNPVYHDYSLSHDATPLFLSTVFHAGHTMTPAAYEDALARWRAPWDKGLRGGYRPYLWVYGYAPVVETAAEAKEAVAALPAYSPLPPFLANGRIPALDVGRALWLAGREDEGIANLKRGVAVCDAGISPIALLHGHAWLGDALAKRGDVAGACAEYGVVLAHWGKAKPRSVTADYARSRRRALACDAR